MALRQGISRSRTALFTQFGKAFSFSLQSSSLQPSLCGLTFFALVFVALIALGFSAKASAQESTAPQTPQPQTGASSGSQAPSTSPKVPGVALYNLLQRKSIVFPDIAASTEPQCRGKRWISAAVDC